MQHEKKHSFFQKIREKGYYIVLGLCVAAVGVSGYLFSRSMKSTTATATQQQLAAIPTVTVSPPANVATEATDKQSNIMQEVLGTMAPQESETPSVSEAITTAAPVDGQVLQTYSMEQLAYNPTTKDWRTHDGIDLYAPIGTEVKAAAAGTVEAVFSDDFFGQTVTVKHANGYVTHYANLAEEVLVTAGQTVRMGDVLGRVGQTALLEIGVEPHLHFSVFRNNVCVDPEIFLS